MPFRRPLGLEEVYRALQQPIAPNPAGSRQAIREKSHTQFDSIPGIPKSKSADAKERKQWKRQ